MPGVLKSWSLNLLEHSGPVQDCNGIALPLPLFPDNIYKILKSYLENRYFLIKYREEYTPLHPVLPGVPQGNVLGPLLYLLYTADLSTAADNTTATFADDIGEVITHEDPAIATHTLQIHFKNPIMVEKMAYAGK